MKHTRYGRGRTVTFYFKWAAIILGLMILSFLVVCGCIYVWNTFFQKEKVAADNEIGIITETTLTEESEEPEPESSEPIPEPTEEEPDLDIVVVDAGHGGYDGGTFLGDVVEKDIALAVAEKVKALLEEQGVTVIMTRETDDFVSLEDRVIISNAEKTDLFVSIHCNAFEGDSSVKGIECYYAENDEISGEVAKIIMKNFKEKDGLRNRGAKEEDYYVTSHNDAPAVLMELGFLSNPTECEKLNDSEYQQMLSEQLVTGIMYSLEMLAEETDQAQ